MWPYFTYNNLEKDLFFICLARIQHITVLIPFTLEIPNLE